ncbi:5'-nucleotidase domain-containing protein [Capsaspora owczarzaki ATCC 30864]|uniref:5'-nucleotidase domain-containing protein n=2 Tax=Capsaspora owczarzaki (strain ATCC 30864) TaxID=595528 RepID=A0A0D2VU15_CAPO3|nr:5'-nucleotidase domain-containing protein [Capsaspora owczarzaki ATCC 30864]
MASQHNTTTPTATTTTTTARTTMTASGIRTYTLDELRFLKAQMQQQIFADRPLLQGPREDPADVFVTNEVDLSHIDAFGFDYDYTLASYNNELQALIYQLAAQSLINNNKYPAECANLQYDPNFAIRGLHYDVKKGLLMKIDAFQNVQLGTVYSGHRPLDDDETRRIYNGVHIPLEYMHSFMPQLTDLFSLPEACLLANLTQFMHDTQLPFHPEYLYMDVAHAVSEVHSRRQMHLEVIRNVGHYVHPSPNLENLLSTMRQHGKKVFLLTNSSFSFVNVGMSHIVGPHWRDLFDVIVVDALKPRFFNESRPFRQFDTTLNSMTWTKVSRFARGGVYCHGNSLDFARITGWTPGRVMYVGDHVLSDLQDPSRKHGWRTGAIIRELDEEITILNSPEHHQSLTWLLNLQRLIKKLQHVQHHEKHSLLRAWQAEKNEVSAHLKDMFNPQFGSVFRTFHNPTYFAHRMSRVADLYTSDVCNFLRYSLDHTFYPQRMYLPHEPAPRRDDQGFFKCGP